MNFQVVPDDMADKLFAACGSDSFEKLDSSVKVSFIMFDVLYHASLLLCKGARKMGSVQECFIVWFKLVLGVETVNNLRHV